MLTLCEIYIACVDSPFIPLLTIIQHSFQEEYNAYPLYPVMGDLLQRLTHYYITLPRYRRQSTS